MSAAKPLVLDVDGTFLKTDMLWECFWAGLGQAPLATLRACLRHFGNRASLKERLAQIATIRTDLLPVNSEVAELALNSRVSGREVVLASGSDQSLVTRLAADYGLSERVFASDGQTNLTGTAKAAALSAAFGEGGFDYAGNSATDMAVWEKADNALVVGHVSSARTLAARGQNVVELSGGFSARALLKSLRPHQWVKNVLLLLPMIAAHRFDLATLVPILWGIVAFSAAASSIYIVNDLMDLEADRLHPTKRNRPFASGTVPIPVGMVTFMLLGALALGIAAALNAAFFGVVLLYMVTSLAYSLKLKRLRWVDIATLALLYTIRVVAGAAAAQVYRPAQGEASDAEVLYAVQTADDAMVYAQVNKPAKPVARGDASNYYTVVTDVNQPAMATVPVYNAPQRPVAADGTYDHMHAPAAPPPLWGSYESTGAGTAFLVPYATLAAPDYAAADTDI